VVRAAISDASEGFERATRALVACSIGRQVLRLRRI